MNVDCKKKRLIPGKTTSIRRRLVIVYSVLISLLVLIIAAGNLFITTRIITGKISDYAQQTTNETREKIDSSLIKIEITANMINNNSQIQDAILASKDLNSTYEKGTVEYFREREGINKPLNDIINVVGDIQSIGIYLDQGKTLYFGGVRYDDDTRQENVVAHFPELNNSQRKMIWVSSHEFDDTRVFSLAKRFIDTTLLDKIGYIVINVDNAYLNKVLIENQPNSSLSEYLIDQEGNIISCRDDSLIGGKLSVPVLDDILNHQEDTVRISIKGVPTLVSCSTSSYTGWKIISMAPLNELNAEILRNQIIIIVIGAMGVIVSLILSITVAHSIINPINHLRAAMKKIEKGSKQVDIPESIFVETEELGVGFQHMLKGSRELTEKLYAGELRKKEAEFKALQAQINPHFLYNTLDTLNHMLIIEGKYDISRIVTNLGDILKYTIRKENNIITLKEDIAQVEKYLYIQKVRFGDRLNYTFDIAEETESCTIIKLLIQPLVENAICHGIEKKRGPGELSVVSRIVDNKLIIEIQDNGAGMTEEMVAKLQASDMDVAGTDKHTRLGIHNIDHRIKLYYGEQYGLEIASKLRQGTCIRMHLPVIK